MSGKSNISPRRIMVSRRLLTASAVLLALPAAVQAQSVNYAELEQMLGEPVTTSVTGKPQRASETPAAVTIITREDIRRSPAKDIVGLVRNYAGVDIARWTAGHSDVSIRGGVQPYNARLLVLVNGQQVYLDHHGMTNWAGIGVQLEDIQQIEVVRGPNSALFGFNAVSGVINIITVNPLQTQQLVMTAEAGTHGYSRVSASAAAKLGSNFGLRLSGGFDRSDELEGLSDSSVALFTGTRTFDTKNEKVAGELYGKLGEQTEAALSASHSYSRQLQLINILMIGESFSKFTSFGGRVSHDTGWGVLSARAYKNRVDIVSPDDSLPDPIEIHNRVAVASADALVRVGTSHILRAGIEYRHNRLVTKPGYPGATRYSLYALNGMWEGALSDTLTATLAGRVDRLDLSQEGEVDQPTIFTKDDFDRSLTAWSFNGALLFKLADSSTLRATLARGVQAPSLFSLGSRLIIPIPGLPFPIVPSGDPSIAPSVIWSGEIGFTRALDDHGSRLELNAFYNHTKDVTATPGRETTPVATLPDYPFIQTVAANVGDFEAYGLEASLTGRVGKKLNWMINYTWTHARQDIIGQTDTSFEWPILLDQTTPAHKVKAQISYERGSCLGTIVARYTSKIQQLVVIGNRNTRVGIGDTLGMDAKIAVNIASGLTLEAAGENLTNSGGVDLSPIPAERRLRASLQVRF